MGQFFDELETRSAEARAAEIALRLPQQVALAQGLAGYGSRLEGVDAAAITTVGGTCVFTCATQV